MVLNERQIGEFESRAFHGDDVWKRWKQDYDDCMAYRKSLKGKPDEEQRVQLQVNALWIEFYGSVLFHSPTLQRTDLCACTRCGQTRQAKTTK